MNDINGELIKLGLGDHEASLYEALLAASPASAGFLAKKCALSRSSVYTTLASLISKGLVATAYKNEVKQFVAQDYSALEQLLKSEQAELQKRFSSLEAIRPRLEEMNQASLHIPQVMVFEGQEGLKKVYLSMMRQAAKNQTLFLIRDEFVWEENWKFIFQQDWHDKIKKLRIEKNIRTKLLVNASPQEKKAAAYYRSRKALEWKSLPAKHQVKNFALYVIGDTICTISTEYNNLVGVNIVNQNLADNYRQLFAALWKNQG